jgi:hypothetical protein
VKTALEGKRFQDVEDIKKRVAAELNALPLEAFAVFKNILNDATNFFNFVEIALDRNETIFVSLFIFYLFFTSVLEPYCQCCYYTHDLPSLTDRATISEGSFYLFDLLKKDVHQN